ncbi:MAG: phosphoribosylglycinamide formyltransferase [Legionellales bacterium]|nr:phosphoribosylglycinamide formyltransferase [Legionellales bacterium]|tara:strand:+ start:42536 stop:43183 length:648 start_codon:yes stop_codon:yes gene_type:complete
MKRLAVFISGNGSNLQAIIDAIESGSLAAQIAVVVSDQPEAFGLTRAKRHNIPILVQTKQDYPKREDYDQALIEALASYEVDVIALAGFMRILSPGFVQRFVGQLVNIHPSLLPKYRGLHTHRQVIENGDSLHGATVHFVTEELDGGPIIAQEQLSVIAGESEQDLKNRVHQIEHHLYPTVLHWLTQDRVVLTNGSVYMDGFALPETGHNLSNHT